MAFSVQFNYFGATVELSEQELDGVAGGTYKGNTANQNNSGGKNTQNNNFRTYSSGNVANQANTGGYNVQNNNF